LDAALRTFEEGVALYRRCSAALRTDTSYYSSR